MKISYLELFSIMKNMENKNNLIGLFLSNWVIRPFRDAASKKHVLTNEPINLSHYTAPKT